MSEDGDCEMSEVEIALESEKANSQAVLDVMTLFCTPVLYSINQTSQFYDPIPEASEPIAHDFQNIQFKIMEQDNLDYLMSNDIVMLIPQLMGLLRECMATHRWRDATEVLRVLSLEVRASSFTLWKAGFEVMMSDLKGSGTLMLQLFKQLKLLSDIEAKDLMVEYCRYLMCQSRWEDLTQVLESTSVYAERNWTERSDVAEVVLKGYKGLSCYVEWLQVKHRFEREDEDEEVFGFFQSSGTSKYAEEELMKVNADKARSAFEAILDDDGLMDVFIMKYTEMLEYYDELDDAETVLTEYIHKQPTNPNSHRYLYWFLKKHKPTSDDLITALQSYVKMIPSDSLAFELCHILKQRGEPDSVILSLVFDYLDYSVRKEDFTAWKTLQDILIRRHESDCEQNLPAVRECWELRSTWWPLYHFGTESIDQGRQSINLLTCKAAVAAFLIGPENPFTQKVLDIHGDVDAVISKAKELIHSTGHPPAIEADAPT